MKIGEVFLTVVDKDGDVLVCDEGWSAEFDDTATGRATAEAARKSEDRWSPTLAPHRVVRARIVEVKEGEE